MEGTMRRLAWIGGIVLASLVLVLSPAPDGIGSPATNLRFEITLAPGLLAAPQDGRVLVVLGRHKGEESRHRIGDTGMDAPPLMGVDVKGFAPGVKAVIDQTALVFPQEHLARVPAGKYWAQAVFDYNPDLRLANAPGNLFSDPIETTIDPSKGGTVTLKLNQKVPAEQLPDDTPLVKHLKIRSELLSRFHGRPIYLRASVILPRDFARGADRKYPLRVCIGGFGTRYTVVDHLMDADTEFRDAWLAEKAPKMLLLQLDGAGPFGDPYQVNSACNGPYGDALVKELIPYVEKSYRGIGQPYARVLDGASTGGWVSLALQVFYPDFFNGAWSHCPDPVDFHEFQLLDLYHDENGYVNSHGFERPSAREINGDVRFTVRHETLRERVIGRGNRWELSGLDWGSWNAVFGQRGPDGAPVPLWDGATGKINRQQVEHWKKYDLRQVIERDWKTLQPRLRGKLRIWVGDADDYFLNNAVHRLDDFLTRMRPAIQHRFVYAARKNHNWRGLTEAQTLQEMADAIARGERER
jgi:hypothetical protein